MGSSSERQRTALGAAAVLLSAASLWDANGLHPVWWLMWLAPIPVLAVARRSSAAIAAAASFAAWATGGLDLWSYYRKTLELPLPLCLLAVCLPALVFAMGALLVRALARRGRLLLAIVSLPACGTAFELLTSCFSPHGTFGSLAYTQMDFLPVVQTASLVGAAGVTFLMLLVPTAAVVLTTAAPGPAGRRLALATIALVTAALAFGGWHLADRRPARYLRVGLAAADRPLQPADAVTAQGQELVARYGAASGALAAAGAEVIVLPEKVLRLPESEAATTAARIAGRAQGLLVIGLARQDGDGERNVALALGSRLAEPASYVKQHLLFPHESRYRPGGALVLVPVGSAVAGLAVCKDLDFPTLGRAYASRGAALLLVPAWDFGVDGWLHSRMAVLRGVEGGFSVARAARNGRLTLSDDRGRILAEIASGDSPTTLLADIPLGSPGTPYSRFGDWFGWLCCALSAFALAAAVRRASPATPPSSADGSLGAAR